MIPIDGNQDAGPTNQRTSFGTGGWREDAERTVWAQAFQCAGKNTMQWKMIITLVFVHNLCMSHLGCSRPVWHHLCSPAACSWQAGSPPRNTWFEICQLQHKHTSCGHTWRSHLYALKLFFHVLCPTRFRISGWIILICHQSMNWPITRGKKIRQIILCSSLTDESMASFCLPWGSLTLRGGYRRTI